MTHARARALFAVAAIAAMSLAACGSSSKKASTSTTTAATTATTAAQTSSSAAGPTQSIKISPDTGLTDGQTVTITGTGYTKAGETLGVTECADKGDQTGAGDCDLRNIKAPVTADASGNVSTTYVVHKGPFGSNNIVCSATQKCLVSVAQAGVAQPDQVASANITFSS